MTLSIYLIKKFLNAFIICGVVSYSIFFIFSLIGNLGERFLFTSILYLSALNSLQIFTYIPSHLFILSFCLFIINLKAKNELAIIKEYLSLRSLFLIIFPILTLFILIEIKKDLFSTNIEIIKSKLISSKNLEDTKISIMTEGSKKKYTIYNGFDNGNSTINQFLSFEIQNQNIYRGEISTNLEIRDSDLYSIESTIYKNNDFLYKKVNKKLLGNFINYWNTNNGTIIKNNLHSFKSNYNVIYSIFFFSFFYFCISIIFLSKKLVNRDLNTIKIFLLIILIFLYYLILPKIMLNNFQFLFQIISLIVFVLIFFKIKEYE